MAKSNSKTKRGLVLGCGGVAGGAWSIAMLDAVEKRLGINLNDCDVFIGTSVGAVLASLLAAGVSVADLLACETGTKTHGWNHDIDTGGALPPLPRLTLNSLPLFTKGLAGELPALTALMGILPQGAADMSAFKRLIDSVVKQQWVDHPATWLMAADAHTGERVALGRDITDLPMRDAVCASYGVPGWCPPVSWRGRTYLDGGIASPTSADFLIGTGVTEAIVLAPMASTHLDQPLHPFKRIERRVRRYMTSIVDREVAELRRANIKVLRLEPGPADLVAFGYNMMDPGRRRLVLDTALGSRGTILATALGNFRQ